MCSSGGVAPYAGAWIERNSMLTFKNFHFVAPYAGAWIESCAFVLRIVISQVAPYAGAWIESTHTIQTRKYVSVKETLT